jgi:PhnB protein
MTEAVKPIPEGYHSLTPYLIIKGAAEALEFYKSAFGAEEVVRMPMPDGRIGHAEIRIGNSMLMIADEMEEMGYRSSQTLNGSPVGFIIYLEDVDKEFQRAIDAGGTVVRPLENKFYGDRMGTLRDPFGYEWSLGTHIEDVSPEEMTRRMDEEQAKMAAASANP